MIIDIHSHILPNADHGSDSLECSVDQCKKAANAGIEIIVATPHFYLDSDTIDNFLSRRDEAYRRLTDIVKKPTILKAAEVTLYPGIEHLSQLHELCFEGTNYILLEMPDDVGDEWAYNSIFSIKASRGLRPIIAHIDRYRKERSNRLLELDVIIQANASAFMSYRKCHYLKKLFRNDKAHVIGSDAHGNADEYLAFVKARKKLGPMYERAMSNAACIIHNEFIS